MQPLGTFSILPDHPCLPGHFPGSPIVPGVLLLDRIAELVLRQHPAFRLAAVAQARFLLPVLPGQIVEVAAAPAAAHRVSFSATVEGSVVLRGSLDLRTAA
jgi:3-hydroxymyristoyl/3-hydroxydecanoyl-(acyl carrier protein) dehydratase